MLTMTSYHDTTGLGHQAKHYEQKAQRQEARVLEYFRANPYTLFTPEQIGEELMPEAPRTSWGRCLSNLTKRGLLVKTDKKTTGMYGRPICYWKLSHDPVTTDWVGGNDGR